MALEPWSPTTQQVGALLRQRTRDTSGAELGDFTPDTRPTDTEVTDLIEQATDDVADAIELGVAEMPAELYDRASAVTALGAAMLVELSFYPDMVAAGRSAYDRIKDLYDERLPRLKIAVQAEPGAEEPSDAAMMPAASFPDAGAAGGYFGPNPYVYGAPTAPYGPEGFGPLWGGSVGGLPW